MAHDNRPPEVHDVEPGAAAAAFDVDRRTAARAQPEAAVPATDIRANPLRHLQPFVFGELDLMVRIDHARPSMSGCPSKRLICSLNSVTISRRSAPLLM